ncbi:MAG TPA: nicotinate phosphoribosyltransferase [Clostridia bacterium]|nr:nicotinate phosphoribosyltransferase [Clostridia bacterium]
MRNLTLLTDLYELTMMNGYLESGMADREAVFDLFFRKTEYIDFALVAGLEQAIDYINNLRFTEDDINYLKSLNLFGPKFFEKIKDFKFTGDIYAMREGEIAFPGEPILTVKATLFEAQLIESALLNIINHQTLIATKTMKITQETKGAVAEFGLRRAQGPDAGIYGSRGSIIGGCKSTSNVLAGQMFDVPVSGTHAHSWVMSFPTEIDAFRAYANTYPNACILLVDTYDTLGSGVPNAITVFKELREKGYEPIGIRIDSGDLAYLTKAARKQLDDAGFKNVKICASGDIDEEIIMSLKSQQAKIDSWGIGTKLITGHPVAALGGVYKLVAIEENGELEPKMKISDTLEKMTLPGFKTVYRIYSEGKAAADLISLRDEEFDTTKPLTIFHPVETWKQKTFTSYEMRELPVPIFIKGKQVYKVPPLAKTVKYAQKGIDEFWEEYLRMHNPHIYKVDHSDKLYDLRKKLLYASKKQ